MTGLVIGSLVGFDLGIRDDKITRYLLDPRHPKGASKAAWFLACGFDPAGPQVLIDALVAQAWSAETVICRDHPRGFGVEIAAIGPLFCPNGRSPTIRTAWNWDRAGELGRGEKPGRRLATFVTAYPEARP